jgi:hypothetical protein
MNKGNAILVFVRVWLNEGFRDRILEARIVRMRGDLLWWRSGAVETASAVDWFYRDTVETVDRRVLSISDRGITWSPAWREVEANAFRVACALAQKHS